MALKRAEVSAEKIGVALKALGIDLVLVDLDDTFLHAVAVFRQKEKEAVEFIVAQSHQALDGEEVRKRIGVRIAEAHREIGVAPVIWDEVAKGLSEDFGSEHADLFVRGAQIIKGVYQIAPDYHYGAKRLAQVLSKVPVERGIVTHANEEWTNLKVRKRRLNRYFDSIRVVDEFGKKGKGSWGEAIDSFKCSPGRVLVVGDNLRSDIEAARDAGVKNLIWVNRESGWGELKQGEVPMGVVEIPYITRFIEALVQLQNR